MSKQKYGEMQEACPLTDAEEMEMMEQQLMVEFYFNSNGED